MTTVLVTGGHGMLGSAICNRFRTGGYSVVAAGSKEADVTNADACRSFIVEHNPELVVHSAAMTNVDGCELDKDAAYRINAIGALNAARSTKEAGARFVYISTDFVFDGKKTTPYTEEDLTHPINLYGESKLAGERFVQETVPESYIIRTSWLYGASGKCFPKTILNLASKQPSFSVVADQIGSPTYVVDLADAIFGIALSNSFGIYHVSNSGECSWYEFAKAILEIAGIPDVLVNPIPASEWPSPATRPAYSVLQCAAMLRLGRSPLRHWRAALEEFLAKNPTLIEL